MSGTTNDDILVGSALNDILEGLEGDDLLQGFENNDLLIGNDDDDTLAGGSGNDFLFGGSDDDSLSGDDGNDSLIGDDDDDTLEGGSGNDSLLGSDDDDLLIGGTGADILNGGGDNDTASYEASSSSVNVNLLTGIASGGDAAGDRLIEIENLIGSAQNDTLVGDNGDNMLAGGTGADLMDGGLGSDTASYQESEAGITINLLTGSASGGDAIGDTLSNIENLIGSDESDTLIGNNRDNILEGREGADTINGGLGSDTASYESSDAGVYINLATMEIRNGDAKGDRLIDIENLIGSDEDDDGSDTLIGNDGNNSLRGEAADDTLRGGAGSDTLDGGDDDDTLTGGAGADTLDGGDDDDTASYEGSGSGVNVNLLTGIGTGGDAEGDRLTAIENLAGSAQNDTLSGDDDDNSLMGGSGNDSLQGNAGDDTLIGGVAADSLDGGDDEDTASYEDATAGVQISLATGTGSAGDAAGDQLRNIENLSGSDYNDILSGNGENNRLAGGNGADSLQGDGGDDTLAGGKDNDTLDGGADQDTASYADSTLAVSVNLATGIGSGGDAEGDRLVNMENLTGSAENDTLVGNSGDNILAGGEGADALDGGAGNDTASYENSEDEVTINLLTGVGSGGDAKGDRLVNIETLIGSDHDDTLIGNDNGNFLLGGMGEDDLQGNSGNDSLDGGNNSDRLTGGSGADSLSGGSGIDFLIGGSEGDTIDGGAGLDTASYEDSASVQINLAGGTVSGGEATGDRLLNIENLIGSKDQDRLIGDSGNNSLEGGGSGDLLNGGLGSDTASYEHATAGVSANLGNQKVSGGDAEGDRLIAIENLSGSPQDDRLIGNKGDNILISNGGVDQVRGKDGNDDLFGGEGNDNLWGDNGDDQIQGNDNDDALFGGGDNDALFGSSGNDTLNGGSGADVLNGEAGNDSLIGEDGNDILSGGTENDTLFGNAGADTLRGDAADDILEGGTGDDWLVGDTGNDALSGGSGNDTLTGSLGTDRLTGGAGIDTFEVDQRWDSTLERGFDHITDLEIGTDRIDAPKALSAAEVAHLGAVASLDEASIGAVLTTTTFAADKAATFTFGTQTFLALNDGTAGFSASNDGLIEITGFKGNLTNLAIADNEIGQPHRDRLTTRASRSPKTSRSTPDNPVVSSDPRRILISDAAQISAAIANARPGDTLVLKNGTYRDLNVYLNQPGITFRAETAGGVTITGNSDIYIEEDRITVSGFKFDQITDDMPIVHFVGAHYSRLTNNAFYDCGSDIKDHIIELRTSSRYNRVDHNLMQGNLSIGIAVLGTRKLSAERDNVEQVDDWYNRIDRNYLKDVPYPGGDVNGREGIQLGQLKNDEDAKILGRSIVELNLLENVDYDPEVISVKTNENIIRFNTIRGSENGGLVVRAGDDNRVEGNFIINAATGIRINGENTTVINNYIEAAEKGIRFQYQPTNAIVAHNTMINSTDVAITSDVDPGFPWSANLYNNIVQSEQGRLFDGSLSLGEVGWSNTIVKSGGTASVGTLPSTGIIPTDPKLLKSDDIYRLDPSSPAVNAGIVVNGVIEDMDGQPRDRQVDIGADELSATAIANKPLTPADVGPLWLTGEAGKKVRVKDRKNSFGSDSNDLFNATTRRGNHQIYGRAGHDEIIVGQQNRAYGEAGNDILDAKFGKGDNVLYGGQGNDEIIVKHKDRAYAGGGDDVLDAQFSRGDNLLKGGAGNDECFLGSGDRLIGGGGRDRFFAYTGGNNTMTGGAGADEFWLANAQLPDVPNTITDFQLGIDVLGISGLGVTFADLRLSQQGANTIVAIDNNQLAILQGVQANTLDKSSVRLW
jgi:Ca2+-binding RTX toxin-like protein